jgi:hypothetical protein
MEHLYTDVVLEERTKITEGNAVPRYLVERTFPDGLHIPTDATERIRDEIEL